MTPANTCATHAMQEPLSIRLVDGSSIILEQADWAKCANANWASLGEGEYAMWRLTVRVHADGRTLVYGAVTLPEKPVAASGELLPVGSSDIESAIYRVAARFDLPVEVPQACVSELAARRRKETGARSQSRHAEPGV